MSGFKTGFLASLRSVFAPVLFGSYISIGALAHDLGYPIAWVVVQTVLVWAGPAQVIMITDLGAAGGGAVAIAVGLSGIRLMPMVVSLLPVLRGPNTRTRDLILPAHFIAASLWVECLRLAPLIPREQRVGFANGLGFGLVAVSVIACIAGYRLAESVPALVAAALLFLTPLSFLLAGLRNGERLADRLALALGLIIAPVLALNKIELDLLWTGLVGGTAAYGVHRLREAAR